MVVGMSGGVDSSVAAFLLAQQDYDLSAVFMRNWDTRDESGTDKGCEWEKDWEDVQRVCKKLDLPCQMIDLSQEYWNRVFEPSLKQWESGVTPNTDVWCNREIKFGALLERLPAPTTSNKKPWIATGHYARKSWSTTPNSPHTRPRPKLLRPSDRGKDQTYYLSSISEEGLSRALFPIGHLQKSEVRELARKHQLHTAERPDSVGICFVGEKAKFCDFLSSYIPPNPGPVVDQVSGKTLMQHAGLWTFTLGENARIPGMKERMFVSSKDQLSNTIYVVPGSDHEDLYSNTLRVSDFTWIWNDAIPPDLSTPQGFRVDLMHRYRMHSVPSTVRKAETGDLIVTADEPEKAVTPGQIAALYDGDWCLGCGVIKSTSR